MQSSDETAAQLEGSAPDEPPPGDGALADAEVPPRPPPPREAVQHAHRVRRRSGGTDGLLRLDLGESSGPVSPAVSRALASMPDELLARYPDVEPLRRRLATLHGIPPERIGLTAGSDEAIRLLFAAYVEEGARVVLPRPTFGAFRSVAEGAGAFLERVEYGADRRLPVDALLKAIGRRSPRLIALSNPDAPAGTSLAAADYLRIAREAPDALVLVNESFVAWRGRSLLEEPALPANVCVLRSLSKDYGLAGLRVGYFVAHPEVVGAIAVSQPSYTVSAPSLVGAMAALDDPVSVATHVQRVQGVMTRLAERLAARGIEAYATEANFLLVKLGSPIQPWAAGFAARGVLVGTAGHVGALAPYVRITVNSDDEARVFLDALDLLVAQGVPGAQAVLPRGERFDPGDDEGMA